MEYKILEEMFICAEGGKIIPVFYEHRTDINYVVSFMYGSDGNRIDLNADNYYKWYGPPQKEKFVSDTIDLAIDESNKEIYKSARI